VTKRQLHVWVATHQLELLRSASQRRSMSVGELVRRLIRAFGRSEAQRSSVVGSVAPRAEGGASSWSPPGAGLTTTGRRTTRLLGSGSDTP
jgi:hypothetical protein